MSTAVMVKIGFLVAVLIAISVRSILRRRRLAAAADALRANASVMKELRLLVLQQAPDDSDAAVEPDQPYSVVMDIGVPLGAASIVSSITGDASIYLTTGAGLLGGIGHENVRKAAVAFVQEAAKARAQMSATTDFSYPADGNVRFYVRTRNGVYVSTDRTEDSLGTKEDPLWPLFYAGQEVITQFRIIEPDFG
ncbi:MAG TPA: hypothetical protein VGD79_05035 [Thermoanaerobaculia bacterium]|jgi:hypothetical protein